MMDLKQFAVAVSQIADEKGIPREEIITTIETALAAAYKKDYGEKGQNIRVSLDVEDGSMKVSQVFLVVDESMILSPEEVEALQAKNAAEEGQNQNHRPDEEEPEEIENEEGERKIFFNAKRHIMLADAQQTNPDIKAGEELVIALEPKASFGRIAAQTAKQVIIQRLREAERNAVYDEFKGKEGEIVSGIIQRMERGVIYIDLGHIYAVLPPSDQIFREFYKMGSRIRIYISKVEKDSKGPMIFVSRTHPNFLNKLFEVEVPEINAGIVEIKAVAREAGSRSKMAVTSHDPNIDAVGACVGQKGTRVNSVMNELGGESIDIIEWDADTEKFIANALSPAKVIDVELNEPEKAAVTYVDPKQLSLAIGRSGQNVRLAAKLTGWKIDVKPFGQPEEPASDAPTPSAEIPTDAEE